MHSMHCQEPEESSGPRRYPLNYGEGLTVAEAIVNCGERMSSLLQRCVESIIVLHSRKKKFILKHDHTPFVIIFSQAMVSMPIRRKSA